MRLSSAEAFAPATIANLGIGFDILGAAIAGMGDTVRATVADVKGVHIRSIIGDGGGLPRDSHRNTASIAATAVLRLTGSSQGIILDIDKGLPLASGLGSSAASAVAGAAAANAALGSPLTIDELLPAALEGEAAVSGYHADNVAPALYGGITLSYGVTADTIHRLPVPSNLHFTLVTPNIEVPTALARSVLPQQIPLHALVRQTGGVARLMRAIYENDIAALAAAMESDTIIEPARAHLMPLLGEARSAARQAGALGLVISGAGPTLVAVTADADCAEAVRHSLADVYAKASIPCQTHTSAVHQQGVVVRL